MKHFQWRLILGTVAITYCITIFAFVLIFFATSDSYMLDVTEGLSSALFLDVIIPIAMRLETLGLPWEAVPLIFFATGPLVIASRAEKRMVFHGVIALICLFVPVVVLLPILPVLLAFFL